MGTEPMQDGAARGPFLERLDAMLADVSALPTLPETLWEIQAQLSDPKNDATSVAEVVESDPSLAANVLKLANSAYSGAADQILSVKDALVRLGRNEVERLSVSTLVIDSFAEGESAFDYIGLWSHSLLVAEVAEWISNDSAEVSPFAPGEAYLAGLLHDVGKLVLNEFFPDEARRIRSVLETSTVDEHEAELETLGVGHGEIGARLMESWGLREGLIAGARWHHDFGKAESEDAFAAEIIALADHLAHRYEKGEEPRERIESARIGVSESRAGDLAQTMQAATQRAEFLLQ